MERKISSQLKELLAIESDSHYIIKDDYFIGPDEITEKEDSFAKRLMTLIESDKSDEEEIVVILQPSQLYNFLINIQRSILNP
jgi:hypothetical protein